MFSLSLSEPWVERGTAHFRQLTTRQLYNRDYGIEGPQSEWLITRTDYMKL